MILPSIFIQSTNEKGRGVFSSSGLAAGTIIEISPVIVMSKEERKLLDQTRLHDYIFEWGVEKDQCCMSLGYVALYNHAYESNCEYFMNFDEQYIFIKTVRPVKEGEELTINYNGDWNDQGKVWFETK
jgi:SET domain-containing protein